MKCYWIHMYSPITDELRLVGTKPTARPPLRHLGAIRHLQVRLDSLTPASALLDAHHSKPVWLNDLKAAGAMQPDDPRCTQF